MKQSVSLFAIIGGVVAIIGSFLIFTTFSGGAEQGEITSSNPTIVAIGDSITFGVGATTADSSYVGQLSELVEQDIINEGVSGDTSSDVLERIDSIAAQAPDIALLFIGGNDALRGVPVDIPGENIPQIIAELEDSGAEVLLLGAQELPFGFTEYAELYTNIVEDTGVEAVPGFFDGILETPELLADPIHPNDEGYALLAERAAPQLNMLIDDFFFVVEE